MEQSSSAAGSPLQIAELSTELKIYLNDPTSLTAKLARALKGMEKGMLVKVGGRVVVVTQRITTADNGGVDGAFVIVSNGHSILVNITNGIHTYYLDGQPSHFQHGSEDQDEDENAWNKIILETANGVSQLRKERAVDAVQEQAQTRLQKLLRM